MPDLTTNYMGLELRNPIIVASCDLTRDAVGIKTGENAGAGAVVLKSIFEEQFLAESDVPDSEMTVHPEALDYLRSGGLLEYAPERICREIETAKKDLTIPVIASINCQTASLWPRFARQVVDAGADALELNIYDMPIDPEIPGTVYEDRHSDIIQKVKAEVSVPVSVKLSPQFSSLAHLSARLAEAGADGLVYFNWFLEPDIRIDELKTTSSMGRGQFSQALRWVALLTERVGADIAASGGVDSPEAVIKQILAGASAVEICSLFYRKGLKEIGPLLEGLSAWMTAHRYTAIADFQGALSFKKQELSFRDLGEAENWFRAQYLKAFK